MLNNQKGQDKEVKMKNESMMTLWQQYVAQRELNEGLPQPPPVPRKKPGFKNDDGEEVHYRQPPPAIKKRPMQTQATPVRSATRDFAAEKERLGGRVPFKLQKKS